MARTSPSSRYERSLAPPPALSLVDVVRALATGGISAEVRDRVLAHGGTVNDPHRVSLPIGALARDFQVAGSGAYVVATDTRATVDALRPVSAAVAAGATVLSGLTANVALPKVTASATSYWQSTESTAVTASAPTVSAVTLSPIQAALYNAWLTGASLDLCPRQLQRIVGGRAPADAMSTRGDETSR